MAGERRVRVLRRVERADQLVGRYLAQRLGGGLTDLEAHVLFHLDHLPPDTTPTMRELRRAFGLTPSTLTAVVDRLEGHGLARRQPNPADRRSPLIVPSDAGRTAIAEVTRLLEAIEAAVAERVTAEELAGFRAVLDALEEALDA